VAFVQKRTGVSEAESVGRAGDENASHGDGPSLWFWVPVTGGEAVEPPRP
jgi:hypothetical protein